jgi:hypothetical protein
MVGVKIMKYYKKQGEVWAFESDGSQDHLITEDFTEMTGAELEDHLSTVNAKTAKQIRDDALASLVHDFGDGRVIQIRQGADESNIRNAIERMERLDSDSEQWLMVDNKFYSVSKSDLEIALQSGQDQVAQIWSDYAEVSS